MKAVAVGVVLLLISCVRPDPRVAELERQLRERDREIEALRAEKGEVQPASPAPPPASEEHPVVRGDDASRALEIALVRQGGSVLPRWAVQVEPQFTYLYSDRDAGRRDTFVSSVALRAGLPWQAQAEVFVPYVFYERLENVGSTSHLGDVQIALTKTAVQERERMPELLLTARWKTETGKSTGRLPTGSGGNAIQAAITAVKTQEPLVLFAIPSYTFSLNDDDDGVDLGDVAGGKLGVILSATPETSLLLDVDVNSSFAARVGGFEIGDSDRVSGVVDLGLITVVSRDIVLNVTTGIGFTRAAPDFRLVVSLPITHY